MFPLIEVMNAVDESPIMKETDPNVIVDSTRAVFSPRMTFLPPYTSVVTFALAFVTLTPNCLARAIISIRFREETALAILMNDRVNS